MTKTRIPWFAIGVCALALLLGVMVGASQTPVAGVAITAAFGLALAALGKTSLERTSDLSRAASPVVIPELSPESVDARFKASLQDLGKLLLVFCLAFAVGLVGGAELRVNNWPRARP